MLKVLRVVSDLYPSVVGGIELHAHEMSKGQVKYGCNVTVYTSKVEREPTQEFRDGYNVVRFRPMVKIMGNPINPSLLFKLIHTRADFDNIHAHSHLLFGKGTPEGSTETVIPDLKQIRDLGGYVSVVSFSQGLINTFMV